MSSNPAWDALVARVEKLEVVSRMQGEALLLAGQNLAEIRRTTRRAVGAVQKAAGDHDRDLQKLRESVDTVARSLTEQVLDT